MKIPPGIWVLGFASFLTDISSEMIYPLLPLFLTQVLGAGMASLGLIEGIAEATAGLSKIYAGVLTDRLKTRKPLILLGYGLSGVMRPLIGLAISWWMVLFFRFVDRVGKGIRTAPRDALIADMAESSQRGTAYGIHRAMDHAGSIGGALAASFLLTVLGFKLRTVFLMAAVPAAMTMVVLWFGINEEQINGRKKTISSPPPQVTKANGLGTDSRGQSSDPGETSFSPPPFPSLKTLAAHFRAIDPSYRRLLICLYVFTLGDVSDAFLLMHLHSVGVPAATIPLLWMLLHVVKMSSSALGGRFGDLLGHRQMIFCGWFYVSCIYGMFGMTRDLTITIALFVAYGLYFGFTEPSERALVANMSREEERGISFGLLHFTVAMAVLPAGLIFGTLWQVLGERTAFLISAGVTMVAALSLLWVLPRKEPAAIGSKASSGR
jgi:MFS family permease